MNHRLSALMASVFVVSALIGSSYLPGGGVADERSQDSQAKQAINEDEERSPSLEDELPPIITVESDDRRLIDSGDPNFQDILDGEPQMLLQDGRAVGRVSSVSKVCNGFTAFFGVTPYSGAEPYRKRNKVPVKFRFSAYQPEATMTDNGHWGVLVSMTVPQSLFPGRASISVKHQGGTGGKEYHSGKLTGPANLTAWLNDAVHQPPIPVGPPPGGKRPVVTTVSAAAGWTYEGGSCKIKESLDLEWTATPDKATRSTFERPHSDRKPQTHTRVVIGSMGHGTNFHRVPVTTIRKVESWNKCCGGNCKHAIIQFVRHTYVVNKGRGQPKVVYEDAWNLDILDSEVERAHRLRPETNPPVDIVRKPDRVTKSTGTVNLRIGYQKDEYADQICSKKTVIDSAVCPVKDGTDQEVYDPTYTNQPRGTNPYTEPNTYEGPDHAGRPAVIQRDAPGLPDHLYRQLVARGGTFNWHFLSLLICDRPPRDADDLLYNARVKTFREYTISLKFQPGKKNKAPEIHISRKYGKQAKYAPCKRLLDLLCELDRANGKKNGSLVAGFVHPRRHKIAGYTRP